MLFGRFHLSSFFDHEKYQSVSLSLWIVGDSLLLELWDIWVILYLLCWLECTKRNEKLLKLFRLYITGCVTWWFSNLFWVTLFITVKHNGRKKKDQRKWQTMFLSEFTLSTHIEFVTIENWRMVKTHRNRWIRIQRHYLRTIRWNRNGAWILNVFYNHTDCASS